LWAKGGVVAGKKKNLQKVRQAAKGRLPYHLKWKKLVVRSQGDA